MADAGQRSRRVDAELDATLFPAVDDRQQLLRLSRRVAVQRRTRLVRRALRMGPAEWLDRGRSLLGGARVEPAAPGAPRLDRDTVLAGLRHRFPLGPDDVAGFATWWRTSAASEAAALIATARTIADCGVAVFGDRVPLRDGRLEWARDPASGRAPWPAVAMDEAGAVAAAQAAGGGIDVKRVWEVGRHQFLAPLAAAAAIADEPAWRALAVQSLDGWLSRNPPAVGVHWASPLEIGLRALAWLWAMPWLLSAPELSAPVAQAWVRSLAAHYDVLRGRLSRFTDPTNHLIGEATAVWMLATVLPELPDARTEAARCLDLLAVEIARQVAPDGVSQEQAVGYHAFVLEFVLQIIAVARRAGVPLPPIFATRAAGMVRVLDAVAGRGGAIAQIGDWDDGRAMPCLGAEDWRSRIDGLIVVGAGLLDVPVRAERRGGTAWARLLGAPPPSQAAPSASQIFRYGGLAVLESPAGAGGRLHAIVRTGDFGALTNAGHAHADVLSLVLRVNDTVLLADPGCGAYTGPSSVREAFRATRLHNTITVDDLSQADPLDAFKWLNLPAVRLHDWTTTAVADRVAASHDGYARLRRPVWHRRDVVFVRGEYLVVVDRLLGEASHRIASRFVLPPDVTATADARGARVCGTDGTAVDVVSTGPACRIVPVPWSPGYGRWMPSRALEMAAETALPATLVTLLLPSGPGMPGGRCDAIVAGATDGHRQEYGWCVAVGNDTVHDRIVVETPVSGRRDPGALAAVDWERRRADGTRVSALTASATVP